MQTAELPEDVLVIYYTALAPGSPPLVRLQVLAAIGCLLANQDQTHSAHALVGSEQTRAALQKWIESEEASKFWQSVGGQITPLRACQKHILVGTRHLLDDLSTIVFDSPRPQLPDLDTLWWAAGVFVDQHLNQESDSPGVE